MKRLLCAATALALSVSCLAACGKSDKNSEKSKADSSKETQVEKVSFDKQMNKNSVDKLLGDGSPLLGYWTGENGCMYIENNEFGEEDLTVFLYQGDDSSVKVFSSQTGSFDGEVENITYNFNTEGEFYEQYDLCNTDSVFSFSINDDNSIYVSCDNDELIRYTKNDIDKSMFEKFSGSWRRSASEIYEVKYEPTMNCPDISAVANGLGFSDECDIVLSKQENEYVIVNVGKDKNDNALISTEITDDGKITSMYFDYSFICCGEDDSLHISYSKGTEEAPTLSRVSDTSGDIYSLVSANSPLLGYWNGDTANMYIEYNEFGDEGFTVFFYSGTSTNPDYTGYVDEFNVFCSKLGVFEYNEDNREFTYDLDNAYEDYDSEVLVYNSGADFSFSVNDDNSIITVFALGNSYELTREEQSAEDYSAIAGEWKYDETYSETEQFASIDIDSKNGRVNLISDDLDGLFFMEKEDFHFYNKEKGAYILVKVRKDGENIKNHLIYEQGKNDLGNFTAQLSFEYVTIMTAADNEDKLTVRDSPILFPSSESYFEFDRVGSTGAIGKINFSKIIGKEYSDETVLTFLHNFIDKDAVKSSDGEFFVGNFDMWKVDMHFGCTACKVITDTNNFIKEVRFYYCEPRSYSERDCYDMTDAIRYFLGEKKDLKRSIPDCEDFERENGDFDYKLSYTDRSSDKVERRIRSFGKNNYYGANMVYQQVECYKKPYYISDGYLNACLAFRDKALPEIKEDESFFKGYKDPFGYEQ